MSVYHNTRQKSVILDALKNHPNHITAEELISYLSASHAQVGRATVYRYLRELESLGMVKKYTLGEKATAVYQYTPGSSCHTHCHLMCEVCGRLEHLDSSVSAAFAESARENYGFEVDCARTVFYGKCKNCREV